MFVGVGMSLFMRGVGEFLVMVWLESGEVFEIREIWGEGKERKRNFFLFIGRFVGVGENVIVFR